jgi:hypothetical protein
MGEIEERDSLRAELSASQEEVARLRRQNHDAAGRRDKETAADKAKLANLCSLMTEAKKLMEYPSGSGLNFSQYQQAATALLLAERDRLKAENAELRRKRESSDDHDCMEMEDRYQRVLNDAREMARAIGAAKDEAANGSYVGLLERVVAHLELPDVDLTTYEDGGDEHE